MKPIRTVLGWILSAVDRSTRSEPIDRPADKQEVIEQELENMALYQFHGCPFCIKVRRALHRLNLPMEFRDARNSDQHRKALKDGGGKVQVPCLRIDHGGSVEWMYESDDIIAYLEDRFGPE